MFFFFKQKTAYEMRISDWSSDVCSSDLRLQRLHLRIGVAAGAEDQFLERIIGAAGRRRAEDRDRDRGQRGVHVLPRLRGVGLAIRVRRERLIDVFRSEEHTSELQSLMRISYAVFCLKNKNILYTTTHSTPQYRN